VQARGAPSDQQRAGPSLLTKAHLALDRLPGKGAAVETPVRNIAQGAKTTISQLPVLRNRFGTGHGRVLTPKADQELALLCLTLPCYAHEGVAECAQQPDPARE